MLLPFRPLMILMTMAVSGRSQTEFRDVIILRVDDPSKGIVEARIESELRGSAARLGDEVSLWGEYRHNTLIVSHGFNHTTNADIILRGIFGLAQLMQILGFVVIFIMLWALCSIIFSVRFFAPF